MERDTSYAAPVHGISLCFDQSNALDLQRPGCPLDPGYQLTVQSGATEVRPEADGKPATWSAALSGDRLYYSYKRFRAGEDDCSAPAGYSVPRLVASAPVISDPVGAGDGYYFLCVIGGDAPSFDSSWQQPSHASVRFKRLDSQPPQVLVDYELEPIVDGYRLNFQTGDGAPNGLGIALTKRGPLAATDCSNPQDYRVQISIPDVVRISDPPTRICEKISDNAGNFADPAVFDFGPPAMLPNAVRNAASLQRGTAAPGSTFRVDTFNLTSTASQSSSPSLVLAGVRLWVLDSQGGRLPVPMTVAGPLFLEAVMPDAVSPGPAAVIVQPPEGPPLSQPVNIRRAAPGLYSAAGISTPRGFAWDSDGHYFPIANCVDQARCYIAPVPLSSTPGGLDFVLYATGLRVARDAVTVRIGTHTVSPVEVRPHAEIAGVDELHFHLPQDFPLHLYQTVAAETSDGTSNHLWIYLE